jgi:hypothetical protein
MVSQYLFDILSYENERQILSQISENIIEVRDSKLGLLSDKTSSICKRK